MKNKKLKMGLVAIAAVAGYCINGNAQSVDSLLDKLVDKGVLTVKEAGELREESDKDFNKAYAAKSGMVDWVSALKFNGDLRMRSESFHYDNPAATDRQRFRYRMRFGVLATLSDNFEVGMRLASDEAANGGGSGVIHFPATRHSKTTVQRNLCSLITCMPSGHLFALRNGRRH